jgi:hypothetical protein
MSRRRSVVSASTPAGSASRNIGRNTAVCTSAARNDEPVSSTISQAAAMACMALPTKYTVPPDSSARKAGGAAWRGSTVRGWGWRSIAAQEAAFAAGHSKLKFGFHNVTGANGRPEALAVDLLDDDAPVNPGKPYLLRLAAAAGDAGLVSGIQHQQRSGSR